MNEGSEILTRLHINEEDGHHQVETSCAETHPVDGRVAHQHPTVSSTMSLITHHVKERHLRKKDICYCVAQRFCRAQTAGMCSLPSRLAKIWLDEATNEAEFGVFT